MVNSPYFSLAPILNYNTQPSTSSTQPLPGQQAAERPNHPPAYGSHPAAPTNVSPNEQ
jgi:hypothetical protein